MYATRMKRAKKVAYGSGNDPKGYELREMAPAFGSVTEEPMIRTQIYLSRSEHEFLQAEATRRNQPMAAVIRGLIDKQMDIPEDAWANNPMLQSVPEIAPSAQNCAKIVAQTFLSAVPQVFQPAKRGDSSSVRLATKTSPTGKSAKRQTRMSAPRHS
jgi:hypothetical protein